MTDQFTRREINRALLVSAFALAGPAAIAAPRRALTPLFDFAIAGGWYHGLKDVRDHLVCGERLLLRAEPANPYDANAVAVHRTGGLMLGYIPRIANEPIVRLLEKGARIEAVIVERLNFSRAADIPDDFVFTGFTYGDPSVRLMLSG